MQRATAIDLFCGCGGMSVGVQNAGIDVIAGVDIDRVALQTFALNLPKAQALNLDLSKTSPELFMQQLQVEPSQLDFVVGGPPCQGFSKNVPRKDRFLDDPKNQLVKTFLEFCVVLKPNTIIMENVAEMANGFERAYTEEIINRLTASGYKVTYGTLQANEFGIPQRRRRAFFLANREKELHFPQSTTLSSVSDRGDLFRAPAVTVWDAIGDLPSLSHGEGCEETEYESDPFTDYQRQLRATVEILTNHVARKLQPLQYERLASLRPGQGLKDLPAHLQTKSGYSGAYGRLEKHSIAPTITRWVFHPGSGRFGHPVDIRTITIREAARLQSFPDWFRFTGTYIQQSHQVGNAVPPLLMTHLLESIKDQLRLDNSLINSRRVSLSSGRVK